jgi:hypothetical protein
MLEFFMFAASGAETPLGGAREEFDFDSLASQCTQFGSTDAIRL